MGIPGSQNGGTVPYKAIFWVYIFLPYIALTQALYMIGTSDLGTWSGHWLYGLYKQT